MPSGKVHRAITSILTYSSIPLAAADLQLLAVSVGIATGLVLNPDQDVEGWTEAELDVRNLCRPLGWIWQKLWWPYGALCEHRGISHWPIVGTLTRAVYLAAPVLIALALLGIPIPWLWFYLWLRGLILADLAHIVADDLVSWYRKKKRGRERRWVGKFGRT